MLAIGSSYTASTDVTLPNGISGAYHIRIATAEFTLEGAPFEFLFRGNNTRLSDDISVALAQSPDLVVTQIVVPANATEADYIDVSWTVTNSGPVTASGRWQDNVVLQPVNRPLLSNISVGTFVYEGVLGAGESYTRTERFLLPAKTEGLYRAAVLTNANASLYEYGQAASEQCDQR